MSTATPLSKVAPARPPPCWYATRRATSQPRSRAAAIVFFVQHFATVQQWNLAKGAGDETYSVFDEDAVGKGGGGDGGATRELTSYVLVNGAYKPTLQVAPGEWTRWRLIYPGQQAHPGHALDLSSAVAPCEMRLLAKDGVYLADGRTRRIQLARVPAGGRADVMVRCAVAGSVDVSRRVCPSHDSTSVAWRCRCRSSAMVSTTPIVSDRSVNRDHWLRLPDVVRYLR